MKRQAMICKSILYLKIGTVTRIILWSVLALETIYKDMEIHKILFLKAFALQSLNAAFTWFFTVITQQ